MKHIMSVIVAIVLGFLPTDSHADDAVDEIKSRYDISLGNAKSTCTGLSEQIDKVKVMSGIGIGAGAVGTVAGGTALVTGIMKNTKDDEIKGLENEILKFKFSEQDISKMSRQEILNILNKYEDYLKGIERRRIEAEGKKRELDTAMNASRDLGNIRTAGNFVAGGTGAVGAITSFSGMGTLDKLIEDINACNAYVKEIEQQKTELSFADPNDPNIRQMDKIAQSCKGLDSKNIADVKKNLTVAGIVSAVGAAAGITGGITSAVAVSQEKDGASATATTGNSTKGLNTISNISAGIAAAGGLGGAILSGVVLSGLIRNGDIANKCKGAF